MLNFNFRRKYTDKSEITPFLNTSSTMSPTIPSSGTATVNRTLLHHQQQNNTLGSVGAHRQNGTSAALRGFAINSSSESPPPDYNMVHTDTKRHAISFIIICFWFFWFKFSLRNSFFMLYIDNSNNNIKLHSKYEQLFITNYIFI